MILKQAVNRPNGRIAKEYGGQGTVLLLPSSDVKQEHSKEKQQIPPHSLPTHPPALTTVLLTPHLLSHFHSPTSKHQRNGTAAPKRLHQPNSSHLPPPPTFSTRINTNPASSINLVSLFVARVFFRVLSPTVRSHLCRTITMTI